MANRRIVDTCVVSYILKNHSLAQQYRSLLEGKTIGLSFMSIAELYFRQKFWHYPPPKLLPEMLVYRTSLGREKKAATRKYAQKLCHLIM
jgi:hypothetical protein